MGTDLFCGLPIMVFLIIVLLWGFIDDYIIDPLIKDPIRQWRKEKEEQKLKSDYAPLKAEIKTIVEEKLQKIALTPCKCHHSTGVKLKCSRAVYSENTHVEHHDAYVKRDDDGYDIGWDSFNSTVYDDSSFWYEVVVLCDSCNRELFSDNISYRDNTHDYEKEHRFENRARNSIISVEQFLMDIYPPLSLYSNNLSAYNNLLEHLRNVWR